MHVDKQARDLELDSNSAELAVEVFTMLADATRIRLILALRAGELSVTRLADIVEKQPAAVSQHLAKLRLARMVTTRRQGTTVFYALADEHALQLVTAALLQAEHTVDASPRHHATAPDPTS
ncbi:ArsR/SmtB family transcription factor [Pseudolysinimonas sp.]|jgi:DNA-binding transcriptional ArsR family regulator|uniref:ArsR/SmtB family transcription factor n=1 Tax=Pseudolysinimonas sp. TaxID=2680009 RepID=UPI00378409E0